jgi:hypothetical protein
LSEDRVFDHIHGWHASLDGITQSFSKVLSLQAQEAAFGKVGEPGDPDRIIHLGSRLTSVYEEFLDWSADLRATNIGNRHLRRIVDVLARFADQPIETMRTFVSDFCAEVDKIPDRLANGEKINLTMNIVLTLSKELVREHGDAIDAYRKSRK